MSDQAVQRLASRLVGLERQVRGLSAPSLSYAAVDGGSIDLRDDDGNLVGEVGTFLDGTGGVNVVGGPVPPTPTAPILTPVAGGLEVRWDGGLLGDDAMTFMGFSRVEIHVSEAPGGYIPGGFDTLRATIESPRGGSVVLIPMAISPRYVVLVVRSTSGKASLPSAEVTATPGSVVTPAEIAAINADLAENTTALATLDTELAQAQLDLATVGQTADGKGRVYYQPTAPDTGTIHDVWFDTDNGHLPHKWNGTTWVATQFDTPVFAVGSITAASGIIGSLDASKITTGEMSAAFLVAGSITTEKMTANSINGDRVTANTLNADKIVANSITADRIGTNEIIARHVRAGEIKADAIEAGAITGEKIRADAIDGRTITGATVRTADPAVRADYTVISNFGGADIQFPNSGGSPGYIDGTRIDAAGFPGRGRMDVFTANFGGSGQGGPAGIRMFSGNGTGSINRRQIELIGFTYVADDLFVNSGALYFGSQIRQQLNLYGASYGAGVQTDTLYQRTADAVAWYRGGSHNGTRPTWGDDSTSNGQYNMFLNGAGALWARGAMTATDFVVSSRGDTKQDVKDLRVDPVAALSSLRPVTYLRAEKSVRRAGKNGRATRRAVGFIAEEVQQVFPEAVVYSPEDGSLQGIDVMVLLTAAIAAQQAAMAVQQTMNADLQAALAAQQTLNAELQAATERLTALERRPGPPLR